MTRIFNKLRYAIIELVRIFSNSLPKGCSSQVSKIFETYFIWVIGGQARQNPSWNPRNPSRNIVCNHRHHLMQPSWQRIFSTSNNLKTSVDNDINSDYKICSFDTLYFWCRKLHTTGLVRAHQRKYWNALSVGHGHDDDGCSCDHRAVSPSD